MRARKSLGSELSINNSNSSFPSLRKSPRRKTLDVVHSSIISNESVLIEDNSSYVDENTPSSANTNNKRRYSIRSPHNKSYISNEGSLSKSSVSGSSVYSTRRNSRRATAEPADFSALMKNLTDDSVNSSTMSSDGNTMDIVNVADFRRKTFDGGMEALNKMLDEDSVSERISDNARRDHFRRATVDPSDLKAMMHNSDCDPSISSSFMDDSVDISSVDKISSTNDSSNGSIRGERLLDKSNLSSRSSTVSKSPSKSPSYKRVRTSTSGRKSERGSTPLNQPTSSEVSRYSSRSYLMEKEDEQVISPSAPPTPTAPPTSAPHSLRRSPRLQKALTSLSRSTSNDSHAKAEHESIDTPEKGLDPEHNEDTANANAAAAAEVARSTNSRRRHSRNTGDVLSVDAATPSSMESSYSLRSSSRSGAKKLFNRRETVDAADMESLLDSLVDVSDGTMQSSKGDADDGSTDTKSASSSNIDSAIENSHVDELDVKNYSKAKVTAPSTCSDLSFLNSSVRESSQSMSPQENSDVIQDEFNGNILEEAQSLNKEEEISFQDRLTRRETVDAADLEILLEDLTKNRNSAVKKNKKSSSRRSSDTNSDASNASHIDLSLASSNSFHSFNGRESIETVALLQNVANTLEDLDESNFSNEITNSSSVISNDLVDQSKDNAVSAETKSPTVQSLLADTCTAQLSSDAEDNEDGNGTVMNADDVLNDSMSTNQSMSTIATMDILGQVQASLEAEEEAKKQREIEDSFTDDDLTSESLAPLADLLANVEKDEEKENNSESAVQSPSIRRSRRLSGVKPEIDAATVDSALSKKSHNSQLSPSPKRNKISKSEEKAPRNRKMQTRRASVATTSFLNESADTSVASLTVHSTASMPDAWQSRDPDSAAMPPPSALPSTGLKSCLSSRKEKKQHSANKVVHSDNNTSLHRSVVFGSPQAAEFNRNSPTTNFTPMEKAQAKTLFSMCAVAANALQGAHNEMTEENDRILGEWERLTNASQSGSDDEDEFYDNDDSSEVLFQSPQASTTDSAYRARNKASFSASSRRKSMLQPVIDISTSPVRSAVKQLYGASSEMEVDDGDFLQQHSDYSCSSIEVTNTISLPDNLAEIVAQNTYSPDADNGLSVSSAKGSIQDSSMVSGTSIEQTEEIEMDLHSLMKHIDQSHSFVQVGNIRPSLSHRVSLLDSSTSTAADGSEVDQSGVLPHADISTTTSNSSGSNDNKASRRISVLEQIYNESVEESKSLGDNETCDSSAMDASSIIKAQHDSFDVDEPTCQLEDCLGDLVTKIDTEVCAQPQDGTSNITDSSICLNESSAAINDCSYGASSSVGVMEDGVEISVIAASDHATVVDENSSESFADKSELEDGLPSFLDNETPVGSSFQSQSNDLSKLVSDEYQRSIDSPGKSAEETAALVERLKVLNAGSRSNALQQCENPTALADRRRSRMSIGVQKRQSIDIQQKQLRSTRKTRLQTALAASSNIGDKMDTSTTSFIKDYDSESFQEGMSDRERPPTRLSNRYNPSATETSVISVENEIAEMDVEQTEADHQLRLSFFKFFSIIQTIKTTISTQPSAVQEMVQDLVNGNIRTAYVDSSISRISQDDISKAWQLSAMQHNEFIDHILDSHPELLPLSLSTASDSNSDSNTNAEQLLINLSAIAIINATTNRKSSKDKANVQETAPTDRGAFGVDRFFNRVMNKSVLAPNNSSRDASQSDNSLMNAEERLQETNLLIDIVNKISYCRVTSFQSSCIKVTAVLSANTHATIAFYISKEAPEGTTDVQLRVSHTEVDLIVAEPPASSSAEEREQQKRANLVAGAFFNSVLCADDLHGPLSMTSLQYDIEFPSQIPLLMQKISGSISSLRLLLQSLDTMVCGDWGYNVVLNSNTLLLTTPDGPLQLAVPVRSFLPWLIHFYRSSAEEHQDSLQAICTIYTLEGPIQSDSLPALQEAALYSSLIGALSQS